MFKVTTINDKKTQTLPEEVLVELFGQEKWEEMKRGEYLPWIEVEDISLAPAIKYFYGGGVLSPSKAVGHKLPWSTE